MSLNTQVWIAILVCLLLGGIACFVLIWLTYKFMRLNRGTATLVGVILFVALFMIGGNFAVMAQPESGAAFIMMLGASITLLFGLVTGPIVFIATTRNVET